MAAATGVSRGAPCSGGGRGRGKGMGGSESFSRARAGVEWLAAVEEGTGRGSRGGGHGGPAADWQLHWAARHSRGLALAFIDGWSLASCQKDRRPLAVVRRLW
jgi:hypothetical protein